ncbi:hypothetical protein ACFTSF_20220 [Kribbella sp. NPDC056951]|uniref:hypothetical protein n=1 Tax=Kribbella sp. NPDC056951 TaxID=3345978 RepID=UPI003627579B
MPRFVRGALSFLVLLATTLVAVPQASGYPGEYWGHMRFRNAVTQTCLTLGSDEQALYLKPCQSIHPQEWWLTNQSSGADAYYEVFLPYSSPYKCLDAIWGHSTNAVNARPCDSSHHHPDQEWLIRVIGGATLIQSRSTGKYLGVDAEGWPRQFVSPADARQGWPGATWCVRHTTDQTLCSPQ